LPNNELKNDNNENINNYYFESYETFKKENKNKNYYKLFEYKEMVAKILLNSTNLDNEGNSVL
jgi:hypothetical protein